jgi:hypothetical protein
MLGGGGGAGSGSEAGGVPGAAVGSSSGASGPDGVLLRCVKLCDRCTVPSVDPETGTRGAGAVAEPTPTLRSYRLATDLRLPQPYALDSVHVSSTAGQACIIELWLNWRSFQPFSAAVSWPYIAVQCWLAVRHVLAADSSR